MKPDLDKLKAELPEYLTSNGFVVFPCSIRNDESLPSVRWDTLANPDYQAFLETARELGVRLVTVYGQSFSDYLNEAVETLEACDMPREEYRSLERRIADLRMYEGFTCELELSFDHGGRVYVFALRTDWYMEYLDLMDEIEDYYSGGEDEEEEGPLGGYFSRN
jgi:hypothetical protein